MLPSGIAPMRPPLDGPRLWPARLGAIALTPGCALRPAGTPRPGRVVAPAAVAATTVDQRVDLARMNADIVQRAAIERVQHDGGRPPGSPVPIGTPAPPNQASGAGRESKRAPGPVGGALGVAHAGHLCLLLVSPHIMQEASDNLLSAALTGS